MVNSITHSSLVALALLVIFGQVNPKSGDKSVHAPAVEVTRSSGDVASEKLPDAFAAEIRGMDEAHRSIRINQSVSHWRLDTIRSGYESILKRSNGDQSVAEAVRSRLVRVERDERSADAARTIENILAQSHRRDKEVAAEARRVAAAARSHARAFSARGYVQASSEMIDGRRLYILIANDGSTIAYLDVPPGLDIDPFLAKRIGVRGEPHFNEDLGARLITVRDVENLSR